MSLLLECKKLKRTGYFPAFLGGGLLAAAFPVVNMAVRSENYVGLPGNPFDILMNANWQMMAMLNILFVVCGACIMYHTEYADNGAQKMDVLPIRSGNMFFGKFVILVLVLTVMIAIETAVLTGCVFHWFADYAFSLLDACKSAGFQLVVTLPTVMLMLVIASACKNMWVSLGIGVILVFIFSILPQDNLILSLCPFSSPYQIYASVAGKQNTAVFLGVCAAETVMFGIAGMIYQKVRRCFA